MGVFHTIGGQKNNFFFPIPEIPKYSKDIFLYYEYVLYIYQNLWAKYSRDSKSYTLISVVVGTLISVVVATLFLGVPT